VQVEDLVGQGGFRLDHEGDQAAVAPRRFVLLQLVGGGLARLPRELQEAVLMELAPGLG
jgi:hypothetical protein